MIDSFLQFPGSGQKPGHDENKHDRLLQRNPPASRGRSNQGIGDEEMKKSIEAITSKNIKPALTELIGKEPDSFLLAVRTPEGTAVCSSGSVMEDAINLLNIQDHVQELRKRKTTVDELEK